MTLFQTLSNWSVDFDALWFLSLLVLLPVFWFASRRSLTSLSNWRRRAALGFRLAVATLLILALAEPNWLNLIHRLSVLFVVDASNSVRRDELESAVKYVNAAANQRDATRGDKAGVVVFGRSPAVEIPPIDHPWQLARLESQYDPQFTNLESALQLAEATLPPDSSRRVVTVSDGNENMGQAAPQATKMLAAGIGFDCVPISYERHGEIAVDKVVAPTDVRRGTPFSVGVVLDNLSDHTVPGKLQITRELAGVKQVESEEEVKLEPGKRVFTLRQELTESGMTTYEARLVPENAADDAHSDNNVASAFCRVGGNGHVLLIEDASQAGRFDRYVELLRKNEIEVTVRDSRRPFDNLADLQEFDCVILADVARVAGDDPAELTQFSDQQIHELVQNTEHFGCGLVVLGGPNSYGAGGWNKTELEKALPVDCQIQNAKVVPVGALMLVIDSSGSMSGEKIAWSKAAAIAASEMLGPHDFIGVVSFDSEAHWIVPIQRNTSRERTKARIDRLGAAGGTDMIPALTEAYRAIEGVNASLKHVILLTDGKTAKDNYASFVSGMRKKEITTTGVALGRDADRILLSDIAQRGGGKFYQVLSPNAIPRVFMREARRVSMPLIFEDKNGVAAQIVTPNEILTGVHNPPPITGYVLTTVKDTPLVDVLLAAPREPSVNSTVLATWQYGLGRTVALTTDVGQRWAADWPAWGNYDKLMLQTIRWAMRPHDASEKLALAADVHDGSIDVVVNALDRDDTSLNNATAVLPDGSSQSFPLQQTAPGRYIGKLSTAAPGVHFLAITSAGRTAPLRAAVNVPATAEFDRLTSNDGFLAQIAEGVPRGGTRGKLIQAPHGIGDTPGLLTTNVFRPGVALASTRTTMWPLLLVATTVLFLGDVFCRRVLVSFDWLLPLLTRLFTCHANLATADARMERLRSSKSSATAHYMSVKSAARFDPFVTDDATRTDVIDSLATSKTQPDSPAPLTEETSTSSDEPDATDFTLRLLEAKKRVRDNQPRSN